MRDGTKRRWRAAALGGSAAVVAVVAAGCVGSVERTELNELVQSRGGGLSGDLVVEAMAAIAADTGGREPALLDVTLTVNSVSASVRSADFPDEVDGFIYSLGGNLRGPTPGSNLDEGEDAATFPGGALDAATIEDAIDDAVEQTSLRGGWAQSAQFRAVAGDTYEIVVIVSNDRDSEAFVFDDAGALRGVS